MDLNIPSGGAFGKLAVVVLMLVVGGCGTGGGNRTRAEPGPPCIRVHGGDCLAPEEFAESAAELAGAYRGGAEFADRWELGHIKADRAYGNLRLLQGPAAEPGAGVTIGFLDSGIAADHPAFAGKTVTREFLEEASAGGSPRHGTAVASVAAGARSREPGAASGVAWGADIAMFSVNVESVPFLYAPISLEDMAAFDPRMAGWFERALAWRGGGRKVDILNLSVGFAGLIDFYGEEALRGSLGRSIAAMAQADAGEKTILVWAAGNAHGAVCDPAAADKCGHGYVNAVSAEVLAGLAAHIEELRGHSIAVAALSAVDGRLSLFSNRCGIAAEFCIAAPGERVRIAYVVEPATAESEAVYTVFEGDGTSYAAPMVSGGLALMKQLFRGQLSNTELVTRLFETADKSGYYADSTLYGQGAMDLGAATSPVGVLEVPAGAGAARSGLRLPSTRLESGPAFGDGFQRSFAGREVMALDRLGAPFWYRLGSLTAASAGVPLAARLRGFLAREPAGPDALAAGFGEAGRERGTAPSRVHLSRLETRAEVSGSHLALARGGVKAALAAQGGLSAAAFTTRGLVDEAPAVGASLSWRRPGSPLGVRAGWIGERGTLLGSAGEGAFGTFSGDTAFVGVDAHTDLAGWRLGANAELGTVNPAARGGLVRRVSPLATSAFALHAARELGGAGALRFSVSQPLRVERGRASLTVPAARTRQGAVLYEPVRADLAPSGRQMDIAGQWRRPLAEGDLRLGAVLSLRPGHRKGARPEMAFLAGWRVDF